jgi:hypothetical protein
MTTGIEVCPECVADLEHCHGAAIVEEDGSYACSDDPECLLAIELHLWRADAESCTIRS